MNKVKEDGGGGGREERRQRHVNFHEKVQTMAYHKTVPRERYVRQIRNQVSAAASWDNRRRDTPVDVHTYLLRDIVRPGIIASIREKYTSGS